MTYDCDVCRSFAGMGHDPGGDNGPTEAEPWHPDCYIHQDRWNTPRCKWSTRIEGGAVRARCELAAGHQGPHRFVYMQTSEAHAVFGNMLRKRSPRHDG